MGDIAAATLSITMIAAASLAVFGVRLAWCREHRKHGVLMLIAAAVLLANVLIWTL